MKIQLINSTKKRLIRELRNILYNHPKYKDDSNNVQNKYSFNERPQRGIIVNGTSADRVRLSADNYMGRISSFCMLTWFDNKPGTSVEWVRENLSYLHSVSSNRNVFPTSPGVYVAEIKSVPTDARDIPGQYTIDPILTAVNEPLITFSSSQDYSAQLSRNDIYPGSVRLWLDRRIGLINGTDYVVNYETGEIQFLKSTPYNETVYADYRYKMPLIGPINFYKEQADFDSIPGCVIAFGDRCQVNDKQAIVITDERTDVADVYGGKYEINFNLVVFTRDSEDREKMSDYVIMKILELQNSLAFEGIELIDISPGGEEEEIYNENSDEYYYESSISLSLRVDWEIYIPLPVVLLRDTFSSAQEESSKGFLDGTITNDLLKPTSSVIESNTVPVVIGKELTYERIR